MNQTKWLASFVVFFVREACGRNYRKEAARPTGPFLQNQSTGKASAKQKNTVASASLSCHQNQTPLVMFKALKATHSFLVKIMVNMLALVVYGLMTDSCHRTLLCMRFGRPPWTARLWAQTRVFEYLTDIKMATFYARHKKMLFIERSV